MDVSRAGLAELIPLPRSAHRARCLRSVINNADAFFFCPSMFPRARLGFLTPRPRYHPLNTNPCHRRALYSTAPNVTRTHRSVARITAITAGTAIFLTTGTVYASSGADEAELAARPALSSLVRAYAVYSMCSIPALVDAAPGMLAAFSSVPGIKQITEAFVRMTFFNQFVGADSAEEAVPLLRELRLGNKGALLAYSVEVDETEAAGGTNTRTSAVIEPHKRIIEETLHCIDVAADFEASTNPNQGFAGRRTWIAIKFTAMLPDAHALIALSSRITEARKALPEATSPDKNIPFPGAPRIEDLDVIMQTSSSPSLSRDDTQLTPAHLHSLREFYEDLRQICGHARERGVKIIIDAEYSWYQPAIDAMTLGLMREFNSLEASGVEGQIQPTVYGTFQAYLRRTPAQLALALEDARKHKYALGVKLVRGAYHPHELAAHAKRSASGSASISPDDAPPVWASKADTDNAYNGCVRLLLAAVKVDVDRCTSKVVLPVEAGAIQSSWASWFYGLLGWTTPAASVSKGLAKVPSVGVLFGTHNWESCALILRELVSVGLAAQDEASPYPGEGITTGADTAERIAIGQLYGMSDDLTQWVVNRISCETPFVIKYVPYGALAEVMPYLSRRAIENKSVLGDGGATHERKRAGTEIRKRIFG